MAMMASVMARSLGSVVRSRMKERSILRVSMSMRLR
jgi:hypothetical protein